VKQDLIDGSPGAALHAVRTGLCLVAFTTDLNEGIS
jgi:hypothetical protein